MKGFKKFFLENCINCLINLFETTKVKDYLDGNPDSEKVYEWLFTQQAIKDLVEKIDINSLIKPLSVGKSGYLVLKKPRQHNPILGVSYYEDGSSGNPIQHRIPCRITKLEKEDEKNEIELERTDGKDFEEISYQMPTFPDWKSQRSKKKILVPTNKIILVNNEKYLVYTRWLTYAVMKGTEKSGKTIDAYFRYFWENSKDKLIGSINNDKIISLLRTTETSPEFFFETGEQNAAELNYPDKVTKDIRGKEGGEGEVLIEFPNGWKWLNLNRGFCRDEGDAGGHCGNLGGIERNENILSLRDAENRVYLTFTIDRNGYLIERKAVGNKKPDKSLHPYIVKLLTNPIIKGIGIGNYLPENDFQVDDLSQEHFFYLKKHGSFVVVDSIDDYSEFNSELMKNIDNIGEYFEKLEQKFPKIKQFKIKSYVYGKYFIVNSSSLLSIDVFNNSLNAHAPYWLQIIGKSISKLLEANDDDNNIDDFLNSIFLELNKNQISEIFDYLIKNTKVSKKNINQIDWIIKNFNMHDADKDYIDFLIILKDKLKKINNTNIHDGENFLAVASFSRLISVLAKTNKDLNVLFVKSRKNADVAGYLASVNAFLFRKKLYDEFFYQVFLTEGGFLIAEKCIQPKHVYEFITTELYPDQWGKPVEYTIDIDRESDNQHDNLSNLFNNTEITKNTNVINKKFMDEFEKNLKYLHYSH